MGYNNMVNHTARARYNCGGPNDVRTGRKLNREVCIIKIDSSDAEVKSVFMRFPALFFETGLECPLARV
jgi:hypothetical protein